MADAFLEIHTPIGLEGQKTWLAHFWRMLLALDGGNELRIELIEERCLTDSRLPEDGSAIMFWISGIDAFPKISQLVAKEGRSAPPRIRITVWEEELSMLDVLTSATNLTVRYYRSPNSVPNSYMTGNSPDSIELIDLPTQTSVRVERLGNLFESKEVALRLLSTKLSHQSKDKA